MSYTFTHGVIPRGKAAFVALAALLALAGLLAVGPALADPAPDTRGICLDAHDIDHTHVLNDQQILFYMKDRKVWLNTLRARCPALRIKSGFVMGSGFSNFCANAQSIQVISTREFCQLGQFTPYEKPANLS